MSVLLFYVKLYVEPDRLVDKAALRARPLVFDAQRVALRFAELLPRQLPLPFDFVPQFVEPRNGLAVVSRAPHFAYEVDDVPVLRQLVRREGLSVGYLLFEFKGKASMHELFNPCLV